MSKQQHSAFATRARARRRAMQALYQWQINDQPMSRIVTQFEEEQDMGIVDREYFQDLLLGVERHLEELDSGLSERLDRPLEQVDLIERACLRLAAYELKHRVDVPYRVILNEAIDLARDFGTQGGSGYVNGVLDQLAMAWREAEWKEAKNGSSGSAGQ
ncbi:MAG: transcription antitermination factor NusB [Xanthomonadales bacterium]|nr:transcription antitermination factor NusB [Xanthomonadales bacterium]